MGKWRKKLEQWMGGGGTERKGSIHFVGYLFLALSV